MIITTQLLRQHDACPDQLALFKETFGAGPAKSGVEVTPETCQRAAEAGLNFSWAAERLLTPSQRAEYERVAGPARAEYERVKDAALAEYLRTSTADLVECRCVEGAAWAEYMRVRAIAFAAACRVAP